MAVHQVLTTPDKQWRAEQHDNGWWLYYLGAQMLSRATKDRVDVYLRQAGVDPGTLVKG